MKFTFNSFCENSSVSATKRLLSALEYLARNDGEKVLRVL